MITLETSQITQPDKGTLANLPPSHASVIELGVLAGLIVVLIGSIWVSQPFGLGSDAGLGSVDA